MSLSLASKGLSEKVTVSELIALIPDNYIDELAASLEVDKWVKKLKGKPLFKLLMFSILSSERLSLRIMEENFQDPLFRVLAPTLNVDTLGWTGIRDRLMPVKSEFFAKLYSRVYEQVFEQYSQKALLGYPIKRYDSTMIATFSHLLEGMRVGNTSKNKTQIKLTTEFTNNFLIKMTFFKEQAHLSEERALKSVINDSKTRSKDKQEELHVFDNGLKSRKTFEQFDEDNIMFITRLGSNTRYEITRPCWQPTLGDEALDNEEIEFVQDNWVKLYKSGQQMTTKEFKLIQFNLKKAKGKKGETKTIFFLTNVARISAAEIAQVYKMRWDIEVLFRFLKQELNLTHFVCNDQNAIQVMLYTTLIAAMLILIFKKKNNISSYKKAKIRFFKELVYGILDDIMDDAELTDKFRKNLRKFVQKE